MPRIWKKLEPSQTAGETLKWCSQFEKRACQFYNNLNMQLLCELMVLLLGP